MGNIESDKSNIESDKSRLVYISKDLINSLWKDEASLIIYELTEYRVRIKFGIERAEINGEEEEEKVNKIYGSIMEILKQICDTICGGVIERKKKYNNINKGMICKRCHKRIIDIVRTNLEMNNRCMCNSRGYAYIFGRRSEILGIERGSKVKKKFVECVYFIFSFKFLRGKKMEKILP